MSSFKRTCKSQSKVGTTSQDVSGVKPSVNTGLGIVSSGNKQLDDLIGGGIALGTITLLETDSFTAYGETLLLYGLSESLSHFQPTLLINEDAAIRLTSSLPYNQTIGNLIDNENASSIFTSISDGSHSLAYCCSYDLSRKLQVDLLQSAFLELCDYSCIAEEPTDKALSPRLQFIISSVSTFIAKNVTLDGSKRIGRIFLPNLESMLNEGSSTSLYTQQISKFILLLKHLIRSTRISLFITMQPASMNLLAAVKLRQIADTVLSVESFAGRMHSIPYEFKEFQGFLFIHKIQQYGTMAPYRASGTRFGLKRDRRKLHIEPLHLPPEESRAFGTAGTATAPSESVSQSSLLLSISSATNNVINSGKVSESIKLIYSENESNNSNKSVTAAVHVHRQTDVITTESNHVHSNNNNDPCCSSNSNSIEGKGEGTKQVNITSPVHKTPLAASIAALKAARLKGATSNSTYTGVSISNAVAAVNISGSNKGPPLRPGQACGSSGVAKQQYEF